MQSATHSDPGWSLQVEEYWKYTQLVYRVLHVYYVTAPLIGVHKMHGQVGPN